MKRFAWRLQRVLDIRKKEEQVKRAELMEVTERLVHVQTEVLLKKRVLKNMIDNLAEQHPKDRLSKQEFFLRCSARDDELIRKMKSKIGELKTQQKAKIAEILKIRQYKEGLEKLREEAKTQFIKEQEKLDQKNADEMTSIGFARKIILQNDSIHFANDRSQSKEITP
jgi:flagellar FliJ protein